MLYGFCEEKLRQSLIILTCYRNAVFLALIKHLKLVSGPHSDEHTTHMGSHCVSVGTGWSNG